MANSPVTSDEDDANATSEEAAAAPHEDSDEDDANAVGYAAAASVTSCANGCTQPSHRAASGDSSGRGGSGQPNGFLLFADIPDGRPPIPAAIVLLCPLSTVPPAAARTIEERGEGGRGVLPPTTAAVPPLRGLTRAAIAALFVAAPPTPANGGTAAIRRPL